MLLNASVCVFGLTGDTAIAVDARRNQIFHQALLDGGVGALGIFPLEFEIRQFLLRLAHAGFGKLPEIRCPVWHPNDYLLVRSIGCTGQHQAGSHAGGRDQTCILHVVSPFALAGAKARCFFH